MLSQKICAKPWPRLGGAAPLKGNRYACEPLLQLARLLHEDPGRAAVVLTPDGPLLERAALLQQGHITPITSLPHPEELPVPV